MLIEAAQTAPLARPDPGFGHLPPAPFRRGQPVVLDLIPLPNAAPLPVAQLHYRQTQQAEAWQTLPMTRVDGGFRAEIPGDYTNSPYALTYYFELRDPTGGVAIYPGFNTTLANEPYFVLRQSA